MSEARRDHYLKVMKIFLTGWQKFTDFCFIGHGFRTHKRSKLQTFVNINVNRG